MNPNINIKQNHPTDIFSDNQGAIKLVNNPVLHQRTKHIDIKYHFIRDEKAKGVLNINYISTSQQPADALTKALCFPSFSNCRELLGIRAQSGWKC